MVDLFFKYFPSCSQCWSFSLNFPIFIRIWSSYGRDTESRKNHILINNCSIKDVKYFCFLLGFICDSSENFCPLFIRIYYPCFVGRYLPIWSFWALNCQALDTILQFDPEQQIAEIIEVIEPTYTILQFDPSFLIISYKPYY